MQILKKHGEGGTNVAELGIGTNESATLTGNVLEDEKILGTAHVAFGASAAIGGTVQSGLRTRYFMSARKVGVLRASRPIWVRASHTFLRSRIT